MSNALFIFIDEINDKPFSFIHKKEGRIIASGELSLSEIATHPNYQSLALIGVLNFPAISEHSLSLPTFRFAEKTIPNLLEDKLLSQTEDLHFAYSDKAKINEPMIVKVIEKKCLNQINALFEKAGLFLSQLVFANLNQKESCYLSPMGPLFNSNDCLGLIPKESLLETLKHYPKTAIYTFSDTDEKVKEALFATPCLSIIPQEMPFNTFFAENFNPDKTINLLQGNYAVKSERNAWQKGFKFSSFTLIASVSLLLITTMSQLFILNQQKKSLDGDIAKIYFDFFPTATQVVSPQIRVERLLNQHDASSLDKSSFLFLLESTGPHVHQMKNHKIIQVKYTNKNLMINLETTSLENLNQFISQLKNEGLNVSQKQTSTKENIVNTLLEVSHP